MSFVDKTLKCVDCGSEFVFSSGQQEFFASKGFTNEPKRCPACREAKKQQSRGGGFDGAGGHRQRQMFAAVCASCGQETEVPFEPREGRPVYCSNCYTSVKR